MRVIPLQQVPSQTLAVSLGGQSCQIDIYQKLSGLYCNLYVSNQLIIGGVICENRNRIVRSTYLGFIGDLAFSDDHGSEDPQYTQFGTRFQFMYLELVDMINLGLV